MKKTALRFVSIFAAFVLAFSLSTANGADVLAKKAGPAKAGTHQLTQKLSVRADKKVEMPTKRKIGKRTNLFSHINYSKPGLIKFGMRKAPALMGAYVPVVNGVCIYRDSWTDEYSEYGLYSIATDGTAISPIAQGDDYAVTSGFYADGKFYAVSFFQFFGMYFVQNLVFDATTGELLQTSEYGDDMTLVATDFAYDEATGKAYGTFFNSDMSGYNFGAFDPETFTTTEICAVETSWNGCAFGADGYIYAIDANGALLKVDKTNGAATTIGDTGMAPQYISSAAFDKKTGRFFQMISNDEEAAMYEVNLATAEATKLFDFPDYDEYVGAWVPAPLAEDGAPAALSDFAVDFNEGSLSGKVSFTAPTTLFDGTAATGALTYSITCDGEEIASGATEYGATVETEVSVAASGNHKIGASVANSVGSSPKATVTLFIGIDMLLPVDNVALNYSNGVSTLTWDAASATVNGGYFDPAGVSYTVTRYPDAVVVSENQKETTFTESYASESFVSLYYTVAVSYNGEQSAATPSNAVSLGIIMPPYSNNFDADGALEGYTQINLNGDGQLWELVGGEARFKYNSDADMDAWLITPKIQLEAGKVYNISIDARANSSYYPERFELCAGTEATADAMTISLIPKTVLESSVAQTFTAVLIPETSGEYYIGIHGCSDADMYYVFVDNLKIESGKSTGAPAAVTNLKVANDAAGATKATVSFTAPTKAISGDALAAITKIEALRDGDVVKTFDAPAVGSECSFVDEVGADGNYTYTVIAYNEEGEGEAVSASNFIGIDIPALPTNFTFTESETTLGKVTLTWDAPTTDIHGTPIDQSTLSYVVLDNTNTIIAEGVTGTSYTTTALTQGQEFVYFGLIVSSDKGENSMKYAYSEMKPVGTPYATPLVEPFNGELAYNWGTENIVGMPTWTFINDDESIQSQNSDGVMLAFKAGAPDEESMVMSGKVDLKDVEAPAFKFWYATVPGSENTFEVLAREMNGEWNVLKQFGTDGDVVAWNMALVDLSAYTGKSVQVAIRAKAVNMIYTIFDNFFIGKPLNNDLAVKSIAAPAKIAPNEPFTVSVEIENVGLLDAEGYSVNFYRDGELVKKVEATEAIAVGSSAMVSITETATPLWDDVAYSAEIEWNADEDNANNSSQDANVAIVKNNLPVVDDLLLVAGDGSVTLDWSAPVLPEAGSSEAVNEGFEEFESFAINPDGEWTFVDVDGSGTYGIEELEFEGSEQPMAYIVLDATYSEFGQSFAAHSGNKYLASFAATDPANDDWMISPELPGIAQTVKFWAKSYTISYGNEEFEFYYSTSGKEITDFVKLAEDHSVPKDWTEYSYNLPEGAKYFAIRCVSNDHFIFLVDDVSFEKAVVVPTILGYNVYRDGVKINEAPVADTSYVDDNLAEGEHKYVVTVVYDLGESQASNEVSVILSGVDGIAAKVAKIATGKNVINIANAEGLAVSVVSVDGRTVYAGKGSNAMNIPVAEGIYVVKAGKKVEKVIVK